MWKHFKIPGDDDDPCTIRPCGRFSFYAGDVLVGHSELDNESVRETGFYRVGEFEPVWDGYLRFEKVIIRLSELKMRQHFRLPAHKQMPELDAAQREYDALSLRMVAPDGQEVPTKWIEITDFGSGGGAEVEVYIPDESDYLRSFPLNPEPS